jgi:AhpD family alkylhydroperoxidase
MPSIIRNSIAAAVIALAGLTSVHAVSAERPNVETFKDIGRQFGVVPKFFELFPENRLPSLWSEYKSVQLNPNTALDAKTKQLIGLAAAAQARCTSCIYFQATAAFANGATFQEVQEAVAIFVIQDNWSKVLTDDTFDVVKRDTDRLASIGALRAPPRIAVPTN